MGEAGPPVAPKVLQDLLLAERACRLLLAGGTRIELWEGYTLARSDGAALTAEMDRIAEGVGGTPAFQEKLRGVRQGTALLVAYLKQLIPSVLPQPPEPMAVDLSLVFVMTSPQAREKAVRWSADPAASQAEATALLRIMGRMVESYRMAMIESRGAPPAPEPVAPPPTPAAEPDDHERRLQAKLEAERKARTERITRAKAEAEGVVDPQVQAEKAEAERIARSAREKAEQQRTESEEAEAERVALLKEEAERLERQRAEAERVAREKQESEARERAEAERIAQEEAARAAREKAESERIARERAEAERQGRERAEAERIAREKAEEEAREKAEAERIAREKAEAERLAREKAEAERAAREKAEAEARARAEAERIAREKAEAERKAREKAEAERLAREKAEAERIAREKAEEEAREKAEAERIAREKAESERAAREKAEAEARARAEAERIAREKAEKEARERAEAERVAREKAEAEARAKAEAERVAREKAEAIRRAREKADALLTPEQRAARDQARAALRERLPALLADPWLDQKGGTWYRVKSVAGGETTYTDLGLRERGKGYSMLGVQQCIGGRSEWEKWERTELRSVESLGQELLEVGGAHYECDVYRIVSRAGEEKLWIAIDAPQAGAPLRWESSGRTLLAKPVGVEKVTVGHREFDCVKTEGEETAGGKTGPAVSWWSFQYPLGAVRFAGVTGTTEAVRAGENWNNRPPFPT